MVDTYQHWSDLLGAVRRCEADSAEPLDERDRQAALELAVQIGLAATEGTVGCSISLHAPEGWLTPVAAGPLAYDLDQVQYATNAGPCLNAVRSQSPTRVDSMVADQRWPAFAHDAANHGVRSSFSLPLPDAVRPAAL